jgi:hypothetical protein
VEPPSTGKQRTGTPTRSHSRADPSAPVPHRSCYSKAHSAVALNYRIEPGVQVDRVEPDELADFKGGDPPLSDEPPNESGVQPTQRKSVHESQNLFTYASMSEVHAGETVGQKPFVTDSLLCQASHSC